MPRLELPPLGLAPGTRIAYEQLRLRFRQGLFKRWRDISGAPDLQSLQAELHRLVGAAGAFGFCELSLVAQAAERETALHATAPRQLTLNRLQAHIEHLLAVSETV
jgi:HPt (histidine-containing phosphotransfer) domain-containing protein